MELQVEMNTLLSVTEKFGDLQLRSKLKKFQVPSVFRGAQKRSSLGALTLPTLCPYRTNPTHQKCSVYPEGGLVQDKELTHIGVSGFTHLPKTADRKGRKFELTYFQN